MTYREPRDFALVIGINDYPNHGSRGKNLRGAVPDATRFAEWLTDTDKGGGLPGENCHLITSTKEPLAPEKGAVERALEAIWDAAEEYADGGRRFYLFFAGHGQSVTTEDISDIDVAMCMPQWSRRRIFETLSSMKYCNTVKRCMPFQEVVAFLDCCRSRSIRATSQTPGLGCEIAHAGSEDVKAMIAYAAEDESQAFEEHGDEDRGYFTTALLAGLKGAAAREAGGVEWARLWEYLQSEVPRLAKQVEKTQNPKLRPMGLPDTAVFGAATPSPDPEAGGAVAAHNFTINFSPDRIGPIVLLDAAATPLRTGDPGDGPWRVSLVYERHILVDSGSGKTLPFMFDPDQEDSDVTF